MLARISRFAFVPLALCTTVLGLLALADSQLGAQPPGAAKPDQPKPVFNPKRPIPEPPGNVLDIESLVKAPPGYTMERRNNFYKKDKNGKTLPGTHLYRWASSGHWSNYDEAEAGNFKLPDPLVLNNGQPVKDADTWFKQRRQEIIKMVEADFYGRVPDNAPKVTWKVTSNVNDGKTIKKTIVGTLVAADGSPTPDDPTAVKLGGKGGNTITITLTLPAGGGPVPVFFGGLSGQECLSMGRGYGTVSSPTSSLISMTLPKGQPKPGDFWGNYRITAWCYSRAMDYLQTDKDVDARFICISGHSTGGKQVLCTAALEDRIFMVVPTSSGKMGAALIRRDIGETLDDQAQLFSQNYCPNVKKWVGRWNDMPFDSHFFIALMAPRLCYCTGGTGELWVDARGQFLACVAADPVYHLLGKKGLGTTQMPKADVPIVNGEIGYMMHTGGHVFTAAEHKSVMQWGSKYMPTKKKDAGK